MELLLISSRQAYVACSPIGINNSRDLTLYKEEGDPGTTETSAFFDGLLHGTPMSGEDGMRTSKDKLVPSI